MTGLPTVISPLRLRRRTCTLIPLYPFGVIAYGERGIGYVHRGKGVQVRRLYLLEAREPTFGSGEGVKGYKCVAEGEGMIAFGLPLVAFAYPEGIRRRSPRTPCTFGASPEAKG